MLNTVLVSLPSPEERPLLGSSLLCCVPGKGGSWQSALGEAERGQAGE